MKTVLLVGGPRDGELLALQDPSRHWLRVAEFDALTTWAAPEDPLREVVTQTSHYYEHRLSFFGAPLEVWLHESIEGNAEETTRLLVSHLLTDKGKAVVR